MNCCDDEKVREYELSEIICFRVVILKSATTKRYFDVNTSTAFHYAVCITALNWPDRVNGS